MSGLRFNLHRDALGRVPPPKHNRPNGRHAATPLQESLQNGEEGNSPEPEDTGPTISEELARKFGELPDKVRDSTMWATPIAPNENARHRLFACMIALRGNGWPLAEVIELARSFPHGWGALGDETRKVLTQLWEEQTKEEDDRAKAKAERHTKIAKYLIVTDAPIDPATIPQRLWLAPPYLMRGQLTLLHGPGAAGKSMVADAWAVGLALGKAFGRMTPKGRSRVLLPNFEDDKDEQDRRITAALEYFGASWSDLQGWLFRASVGALGDVTMFKLDEFGAVSTTEAWEALELLCEDIRPDVIFPDPLVAINAVPENDNILMRRVMVLLKQGLAKRFNAAVAPIHHDNKGGSDDEANDQNNARGGGDIVNAARFELAVRKMTAPQADQWNIKRERRGYYFRVGSVASKINYAAPEESEWFERLPFIINGEAVVRCIPWQPPSGKLTEEQAKALIAAIGRGTEHGPYSPQLGNTSRSLTPIFEAIGIAGDKMQRRALNDLLTAGQIEKAEWRRPGHGALTRTGLRTPARLPYNCEWCDAPEADPC